MTQERLNAVAVCHVHQDVLDNVDISELAADFARSSDIKKSIKSNQIKSNVDLYSAFSKNL